LTYALFSNLQAGVEYNPRADNVSPLVNWRLLEERRRRPAVILGSSSDRIGTPSGQSFYVTVSKDLKEWAKLPIAPYAGVAYGSYDHRTRAIGGLNVILPAQLSALVLFDGVHVHPTLSFSHHEHVFSLLLVRVRDVGLSYSLRF
jgi:hypothetical protein